MNSFTMFFTSQNDSIISSGCRMLLFVVALAAIGRVACSQSHEHDEGSCHVSVSDFGAVGDNTTDNKHAFDSAIASCSQCTSICYVTFSSGTMLTSPFSLRSNMAIILPSGNTIQATPDASRYPRVPFLPPSGPTKAYQSIISCDHCENVTLLGGGVIDGTGWQWWLNFSKGMYTDQRPKLFEPAYCRNVHVQDITFKNSPFWTVHPIFCNNVTFKNVTVLAPRLIGNTDGIDYDSCTDSLIEDCHVDVGDDGVCIKSAVDGSGVPRPSDNITIRNTLILSRNFAIGSDTSGNVTNILMENCQISGDEGTAAWAIKIKSHENMIGVVENITFRNLTIGPLVNTPQQPHAGYAFSMYMTYGDPILEHHAALKHVGPPPLFRNITFQDISIKKANLVGSIAGLNNSIIQDIHWINVNVESYKTGWECHYTEGTTQTNLTPPWPCA